VHFKVLDRSTVLEERMELSKSVIGILHSQLIPKDEIPYLYCMASIFEEYGKEVIWGKRISGTWMVMYGMMGDYQLTWWVSNWSMSNVLFSNFWMYENDSFLFIYLYFNLKFHYLCKRFWFYFWKYHFWHIYWSHVLCNELTKILYILSM